MNRRAELERLVWKHTHKDFKGKLEGAKTVLIGVPTKGTCIVLVASLTEEQCLAKLPAKVRDAFLARA